MSSKDEESLKWQNRLWLLVLCSLMFIAVILALQITWTPDQFNLIIGVQGRYFLPILPLFLVLIHSYLTLNMESKFINVITIMSILCLNIMEVMTILIIVIGR